jgi:hypothetical protein
MALATLSQSGYSVKPIQEKLGYKPGSTAAFVALPEELHDLPATGEFGKIARRQDWSRPLGPGNYDTIHAFTTSRAELAAGLQKLRRHLNSDGMIWISWPKKSAGVATDITEDVVRSEALKASLVDVKVAAIDDVWSGLKLVIPVHLR